MKKLLALLSVFLALPVFAADLIVSSGATSIRVPVFVSDSSSSTGEGLTGLAYNGIGANSCLTCNFFREATGSTSTAISMASSTLGTYTSGCFKEIDSSLMKGWYEFCPPDAAFATGASRVGFQCRGCANMATMNLRINLGLPYNVVNPRGTLAGATSTSAVLSSSESFSDNAYVGSRLMILDGTAGGTSCCVTSSVGSTKTVTCSGGYTAGTPDTTSRYDISFNGCADVIADNGIRNACFVTDAINARVVADSTFDEGAVAANTFGASEFANNAFDGTELGAGFMTKVVNGIFDEAAALHVVPTTMGGKINTGGTASSGDIVQ